MSCGIVRNDLPAGSRSNPSRTTALRAIGFRTRTWIARRGRSPRGWSPRGFVGSVRSCSTRTGSNSSSAFFGCLYAGVIAVPCSLPRRDRGMDRLRGIVADCSPRRASHDLGTRGRTRPLGGRRAGLGGGGPDRDGRGRRTPLRRLAKARPDAGLPGLPPVHVGLDRRAEGRDDLARQFAREFGPDPRASRPTRPVAASSGSRCSTTWG